MIALAGALAMAAAPFVSADPLPANGSWHAFDVDPGVAMTGGFEWISLDGSALAFDALLDEAAVLTIVDAGFAGDVFEVFDNGVSLGLTSPASDSYPASVGLDFAAALASGTHSTAQFSLGAGSHRITGRLWASALDSSGAAIDATVGAVMLSAIPEPSTAVLLGAGMLLAGGFVHRRHRG
jgi:hypothetical protein